MMRIRFHQGLDELKEKLLAMGGLAEQSTSYAVKGYWSRDTALCDKVFGLERQINQAEREIDELALDLLAMQQPMAVDLRFINACMKINADLERVGDQAVNIAERGVAGSKMPAVDLKVDIPLMAANSNEMVRKALESFIHGQPDLAESVLTSDDVVDQMDDEIFMRMTDLIQAHPEHSRQALDAILVSRNLERIADHATNIAEDVIFWIRGADVRHGFRSDEKTGD